MTTPALNARRVAVLAGFSRGWIETRQNFTETVGIIVHVFPAAVGVILMLSLSRNILPGTHLSSAALLLPGFLCMAIVTGGLSTPSGGITSDREDGTLLRAKATPNGMLGYLIGKIVTCALTTLLGVAATLVPGMMIASGLNLGARTGVLLTLTFVVGMVSTVPIGVALGSILKSSSQIPLVPLVTTLLIVVSVFLPIALLPPWLQLFVQAFPVYWVGLGVRSAMFPMEMVAAELGKWGTVELFAVPAVWAAFGLLLAPILLRRMARRQSGSELARMRNRTRSKR